MNTTSCPRAVALPFLLAALALTGCGGSLNFPDAVSSQQVQGPAVRGSVYGGHAPIVGSHVYVLQPGTSGYGSPAISLLGAGGQTSASGYTITENSSQSSPDPNVPGTAKFVTTDSSGSFNLTGGYSCTAGEPVFLYSFGGATPATQPPTTSLGNGYSTTTYATTNFVVSNATTGANGTATYTVTTSPASNFTAGETVTMANASPVNGPQTVLAANLTPTQFSFVATDVTGGGNLSDGSFTDPSGTVTGYGTNGGGSPTTSPIVQLATLGICPSSGNFSTPNNGALSYVYMNEVSTVATAYTFQPFTVATNNSAWDIGTTGTTAALTGISNAALTAAQLYSIQGTSQISTSQDGEGHIANYQTQKITFGIGSNTVTENAGNGIVPQATIDTLANILAACIDSTPGAGGALSAQCSTLFNTATDNGSTLTSGDTAPTDTATAAINIARYPAGNHSATPSPSFVTDLFGLSSGTVPYAPSLNKAPNDWTVAINYPEVAVTGYPTATNPYLGRAESLQIDGSGQIWITSQAGSGGSNVVRWSNLGIQNVHDTFGYIPGYVSVDGNGNAWTGNANSTSPIYEAGSNGIFTADYGSGYNHAYLVITDKGGDAFTFASTANTGGNYEMFEYPYGSTTTAPAIETKISPSIFTAGTNAAHGAIDASGDLWVTTESPGNQIARFTTSGKELFTPITTQQQPEVTALDHSGNAWIPIQTDTAEIYKVTSGGGSTILNAGSTGARMTSTFGAAVDGNGNVWFTNGCGNYHQCGSNTPGVNTVFVINGSNQKAISPATNYIAEGQYGTNASNTTLTPMFNDPLNIAIDPSGDVWVTNYIGNSVTEIVGAAAPVVTPLSVAAGTDMLGVKP